MTPFIGSIIEAGMKVLDRVLPDPQAKAAAQLELLKLQQAGEFKQLEMEAQLALGQIEVNKAEAASGNKFASSWRPSAGYVCVLGLFYQFLLQPILGWLSGVNHWAVPPQIELGDLMTLLGGMLGLGAMRTTEKLKGKA